MSLPLHREIRFSRPGIYHIRVLGILPSHLWECFEGEVQSISEDKNGQIINELKFHVRDQVELSGIVDVLFKQGNTLLAIERKD